MLSKAQLKVIQEHPLSKTLDNVRVKLHRAQPPQIDAVAGLLGVLFTSSAAFHLSDGGGNIAEQLFLVHQSVRGGKTQLQAFIPLIDAVIAEEDDAKIWQAVLDIIHNASLSTLPLSSIVPTFLGTPVKSSSSRLDDSETRGIVERELFSQIKDCTHRHVPGFLERHFDSTRWTKNQQKMLESILTCHDGTRWKDWPMDPWEQPVWNWLTSLEKDAFPGAEYTLYTNRSAREFEERKGRVGVFFQTKRTESSRSTFKDVLVVGEHRRTACASDFKSCLLQLARHVRSVFADQPLRRFVHAFTLRGTIMELWVFDRSGPYSSGGFDIHREPKKLAQALVAYATMEAEDMGLDLVIKRTGNQRFISVTDAEGNDTPVELDTLLVRQQAIVSRGTICFSTKQGVAKFSWLSDKRPSEVRHLKLAHSRGVEGVAALVAHREILSISDLRNGLDFSNNTRHNFEKTRQNQTNSYDRNSVESSASSKKRKFSEDDDETLRCTKRRSNTQGPTFGYRTSNSRSKPSLDTQVGSELYENRILSCLVISPAGRVLSDFRCIKELLEALRDAIKAHRSLYMEGRILHRDISSNNIIITDAKKAGGYKGMLIDLDLAKERDSGPSGSRHQTGTKQFMAIEVLRGTDHTYRHDLESFFYVLLWMCARCAWKNVAGVKETEPAESILRQWEIGSFKEIASAKIGFMTVNGLEDIMDEFPQAVQVHVVRTLCLQIRSVLFGDAARMLIGTPADPNQLYSSVINAYDETIQQL
ncbi:serine/threonine-protein kinase Sgk2 [Trichoderma chlorosporum]